MPSDADKASIVEEAITYIQTLEGTVQKLEQLKLERKRAQEAQRHQVGGGGGSSAAAPAPARHPTPAPAPASREAILADTVRGWNAQPAAVAAAKAAAAAAAGGSSVAAPEPPFQTWSGPNMVVSLAGNEGYIKLRAPRQPGILTKLLFALERHGIDVVTTTISGEGGHKSLIIHARINATFNRFAENLTTEDRFKLAVSEMLHLISN
ncbi:hypothetical protein U9M48_032545 [Paspalum notatum var. saurae]|uniref:BHLH domain-containing protein n=1 Tax=Paspalum notatum var. saurae TaxID=547442 RepID=A0AAQ3X4Y3_PASNO